MTHPLSHQEKIDSKFIQKWRNYVRLRWLISVLILVTVWYLLYINKNLLAGATFFGAAVVVALQSFVSSFFAYIYITSTAQFEEWDIIKTGNPFMSAFWEVKRIGFFFTTIREVDEEMLFTGKLISFPNNLIFSGGIFNYTRKDLLFRHEFTVLLDIKNNSPKESFHTYRNIIMKEYYKTLENDLYYKDSMARENNPKFDLKITDKWLECKTRILVHFYALLESNNTIMLALLEEHTKWHISIVKHKDYDWM